MTEGRAPLRETELTVGELVILATGCPRYLPGEPFDLRGLLERRAGDGGRPRQVLNADRLRGALASLGDKGLVDVDEDGGGGAFTTFGEACWKAYMPKWEKSRNRSRGGKHAQG